MDFRRGHRVTNVFRKRSQGHGRISAVTNCDPGRGRMHCAYGSDRPLIHDFTTHLHIPIVVTFMGTVDRLLHQKKFSLEQCDPQGKESARTGQA